MRSLRLGEAAELLELSYRHAKRRVSTSSFAPLDADWACAALFFEARTTIVTMLLVIAYCATQPGIRDLQGASFLLGEVRILERGKNVIEFRFQFLKLGTEHTTSISS